MVKLFNLDTNWFISKGKKLEQTMKSCWSWMQNFNDSDYIFSEMLWKTFFPIPSMHFKSFWMYKLCERAQLKDSKRSLMKAATNLSQNANESPTALQ